MQKFTIRDIENMCGIKAHTLRTWEQRYQLCIPKRKESAHRFYDNEDLKKLLQVSYLYHTGYKVSKIAALGDEAVTDLVRHAQTVSQNYVGYILQLLEAAIDFNDQRFNQVLEEVNANIGLEQGILNVGYPFLQKVGLLWMTSNIIPAQEHFSTYLIQHKIIAETDKLPLITTDNRTIVLFTPDGEHHELPLLFINYLLKKSGWRTLYFGANVKWQHLQAVIEKEAVSTVYLHLITNFTRFEIDDYLEMICKAFPEKKIVASGAAIQPAQRTFLNLKLLKSDASIHSFVTGNPILATHK